MVGLNRRNGFDLVDQTRLVRSESKTTIHRIDANNATATDTVWLDALIHIES